MTETPWPFTVHCCSTAYSNHAMDVVARGCWGETVELGFVGLSGNRGVVQIPVNKQDVVRWTPKLNMVGDGLEYVTAKLISHDGDICDFATERFYILDSLVHEVRPHTHDLSAPGAGCVRLTAPAQPASALLQRSDMLSAALKAKEAELFARLGKRGPG